MVHDGGRRLRPVDLAREHGISPQAVRNYETDGVLPAVQRTASGYRAYTQVHAQALRAYLALVAAHGYPTGGEVMRAIHRDDRDAALRAIDDSHAVLLRDRETLDAVEAAIGPLTVASPPKPVPDRGLTIGELAHRIGVVPATLRTWQRSGILVPHRDPATRYRRYGAADVRDAQLAHLLRRGGFPLTHIATVLDQVRGAGGPEPLVESLADWRRRLTGRGRAMLTAAGSLADYLQLLDESTVAEHSTESAVP